VRVAALAALEFRKNWRPGQAELVLEVALKASEPAVRAAAVSALANLDDRMLIERLATLLQDPSWEVRRSAAEALLWNTEHRWSWIRLTVRQALADPLHEQDGPLQSSGQLLTPEALADLNAWASEKGLLGVRAAQMLGRQYTLGLQENQDRALLDELYERLIDPHAPPALRIELAQIMRNQGQWDEALQEKLLEPANPAALRLLAAEALLADGKHAKALATLYDVARLPNREIALTTADIAQRYLGIDFGLVAGQPLPALQSRQAAEVTRRVMVWAAQQEPAAVPG
jgi:HEAT repeats